MLERFRGTVERICAVDPTAVVRWITAIPLAEWPQQRVGQLWPAMITDLDWRGFGKTTDPVVIAVMERFPGAAVHQRMLSVVMPGREIEPHIDHQPPHWKCRVHVPLLTNPESEFIVGGEVHRLEVGYAYRVNTEAEHSVRNSGTSPRIHFMFDVRADD